MPLLERAIAVQADSIIVHHGIFGKNFFRVTGRLKEKVHALLSHDISLFGIHLPMDAHKQLGNNAQLLSYLGAEILEELDVGFIAQNSAKHRLSEIVEIFHQKLQRRESHVSPADRPSESLNTLLHPRLTYGFLCYPYGPERPERLAIVSGGSSRLFRSEELERQHIDTFICGSVDESTAAIAYESHMNFLNIGHYWSEKAGPLALQAAIEEKFDVETRFIDVENMV
jgi:putative NIF3 family GTP cyclohydrolase 1 type 2